MPPSSAQLSAVFQSVAARLEQQREEFNRLDLADGNHGDHLVEVFETASRAVERYAGEELSEAMEAAAAELDRLDNGTARVYAEGLSAFARAFRAYAIRESDLAAYLHAIAADLPAEQRPENGAQILKSLVVGLGNWQQGVDPPKETAGEIAESDQPEKKNSGLNVSGLFELGIVYMQAKSRGGSRTRILADAAVSASPLVRVPYRAESGKLAIQAFLEAFLSEHDETNLE